MNRKIGTKIVAIVISTLMVLSLTGCKGNENTSLSNQYITIKKYIGLEIAKVSKTEITDTMVDEDIQSQMAENGTSHEVTDRPIEAGDTVTCDYTGTIDGVQFSGGSQTDASISVTKSDAGYITGFTSSMIGHNIGDEFDATMKFPDDYANEEVKGKTVVFHYVIKKITAVDTPELTDEYVKNNVDGYNTVDEWKAGIKKELEESAQDTYDYYKKAYAWSSLLEQVEVKGYDDEAVNKEVDKYKTLYQNMASKYSMTYDNYISQALGMTASEFNEKLKTSIEQTFRDREITNLIAQKEGITVSNAEYDDAINNYCTNYNCSSEEDFFEKYGDQITKTDIQESLLMTAVKGFIASKAVESDTKAVPSSSTSY